MKNSSPNLISLPWDKVASIDISAFEAIPTETLEFASNEANHDQMFESALKNLHLSNPNATFEEAEKLVKMMKHVAQDALNRKIK